MPPKIFACVFFAALFFSCGTPPATDVTSETVLSPSPDVLRLTFAGDIMAHSVNVAMSDYSLIYKDIESVIQYDDLTFANFETPVYAQKPYESYPTFNVQPPYADAAIKAGFDVFSLANNHTNDQGKEGIAATRAFFSSQQNVYAAGIKESADAPLTYCLIEARGWKILFAAVTELLNQSAYREYIDYVPMTRQARDAFTADLKALREAHPADIFVLSLHSGEEEYIHTVSKERREFYYSLLAAGVDILWANHVHIAREWEAIGSPETGEVRTDAGAIQNLVFYSAGNTISGQRTRLNFSDPASNREYTGDGFLYSVEITRRQQENDTGWDITSVTPILITTYRDEENRYVIKRLNDFFVADLREKGKTAEADYFAKRKQLMELIQGKTIWK